MHAKTLANTEKQKYTDSTNHNLVAYRFVNVYEYLGLESRNLF